MMFAAVQWRFLRKSGTNIIVVIGESSTEEVEPIMVIDSLKIVGIAKKYNGIPVQSKETFKIKTYNPVVVRMALWFGKNDNANAFLNYVRSNRI